MRVSHTLLPLVLLGCVGACASEGGSSSRDRTATAESNATGSLNDQLSDAIRRRRERAQQGGQRGDGTQELPAGWRERFDATWRLFVSNDSRWPEAEKEWVSLGPAARNILAENLLRSYVGSRDSGNSGLYHRSREALVNHREAATPYLVEGLSRGHGDSVVRNLLSELLAYLGDGSMPTLTEAYDDADGERGRRALVRAARLMRSPRAVPFLMEVAGSNDEFTVRIEALQGLEHAVAREAVPVFRKCMKDDDPSVRKFAAGGVSKLGDSSREVLLDLVSCYERAVGDGEREIAREARESLVVLLGTDAGSNPEAWRRQIAVKGR